MTRPGVVLCVVPIVLGIAASSAAQVPCQIFRDRAAFEAAAGPVTRITFDGILQPGESSRQFPSVNQFVTVAGFRFRYFSPLTVYRADALAPRAVYEGDFLSGTNSVMLALSPRPVFAVGLEYGSLADPALNQFANSVIFGGCVHAEGEVFPARTAGLGRTQFFGVIQGLVPISDLTLGLGGGWALRSVTLGVTEHPNLTMSSVAFNSAAAVPGENITLTDTIENTATLASVSFSRILYYLDATPGVTSASIQLEGDQIVGFLAPGASRAGGAFPRIPATTPSGDYYVIACADGGSTVQESNETDNCRASSTRLRIVDNTLELENVSFNQSVIATDRNGDGRVDLIAGRPTRIRVRVLANDTGSGALVTVRVMFGSTQLTRFVPLATLASNPIVDFHNVTLPRVSGELTVTADVDPFDSVSPASPLKRREERVWLTIPRMLSIAVYPLSGIAQNQVQDVFTDGLDYLNALFPTDPQRVAMFQRSLSPPLFTMGDIDWDARVLALQNLLTDAAERVVAVAPHTWFDRQWPHDPLLGNHTLGIVLHQTPHVMFVRPQLPPEVLVHEMGHSYGFCHNEGFAGPDDEPFWVTRPQMAFVPRDYMRRGGSFAIGVVFPYPDGSDDVWTPKFRFDLLADEFALSRRTSGRSCSSSGTPTSAMTALESETDEPVVVVAGTVSRAGGASLNEVYTAPNGFISAPRHDDGNVAVRVLDRNRQVVTEARFRADFRASAQGPVDETFEVDSAPFVVSLPYSAGATYLELVRDGQRTQEVSIAGKGLLEAVRALPEAAVKARLRDMLIGELLGVDRTVRSGDLLRAAAKLELAIRPHVQEWVNEYTPGSPLELSKPQLLALVDDAIARLGQ